MKLKILEFMLTIGNCRPIEFIHLFGVCQKLDFLMAVLSYSIIQMRFQKQQVYVENCRLIMGTGMVEILQILAQSLRFFI